MAYLEVRQLITLLYCFKKTLEKFNKYSMGDDDDNAFKKILFLITNMCRYAAAIDFAYQFPKACA